MSENGHGNEYCVGGVPSPKTRNWKPTRPVSHQHSEHSVSGSNGNTQSPPSNRRAIQEDQLKRRKSKRNRKGKGSANSSSVASTPQSKMTTSPCSSPVSDAPVNFLAKDVSAVKIRSAWDQGRPKSLISASSHSSATQQFAKGLASASSDGVMPSKQFPKSGDAISDWGVDVCGEGDGYPKVRNKILECFGPKARNPCPPSGHASRSSGKDAKTIPPAPMRMASDFLSHVDSDESDNVADLSVKSNIFGPSSLASELLDPQPPVPVIPVGSPPIPTIPLPKDRSHLDPSSSSKVRFSQTSLGAISSRRSRESVQTDTTEEVQCKTPSVSKKDFGQVFEAQAIISESVGSTKPMASRTGPNSCFSPAKTPGIKLARSTSFGVPITRRNSSRAQEVECLPNVNTLPCIDSWNVLGLDSSSVADYWFIPTNVIWIDAVDNLQQALIDLRAYDVLSVDCEGMKLSKAGELCIIQIGTAEGVCYIIDIHTIGMTAFDIGLRCLLEDENVVKIMQDARQDCDALAHQFNVSMGGIWDTQIADILYRNSRGEPIEYVRGLGKLLEKYLNFPMHNSRPQPNATAEEMALYATAVQKRTIAKKFDKAPALWQHRPLDPAMIWYAAFDVICLCRLMQALRKELLQYFGNSVDIYVRAVSSVYSQQFVMRPQVQSGAHLAKFNKDIIIEAMHFLDAAPKAPQVGYGQVFPSYVADMQDVAMLPTDRATAEYSQYQPRRFSQREGMERYHHDPNYGISGGASASDGSGRQSILAQVQQNLLAQAEAEAMKSAPPSYSAMRSSGGDQQWQGYPQQMHFGSGGPDHGYDIPPHPNMQRGQYYPGMAQGQSNMQHGQYSIPPPPPNMQYGQPPPPNMQYGVQHFEQFSVPPPQNRNCQSSIMQEEMQRRNSQELNFQAQQRMKAQQLDISQMLEGYQMQQHIQNMMPPQSMQQEQFAEQFRTDYEEKGKGSMRPQGVAPSFVQPRSSQQAYFQAQAHEAMQRYASQPPEEKPVVQEPVQDFVPSRGKWGKKGSTKGGKGSKGKGSRKGSRRGSEVSEEATTPSTPTPGNGRPGYALAPRLSQITESASSRATRKSSR